MLRKYKNQEANLRVEYDKLKSFYNETLKRLEIVDKDNEKLVKLYLNLIELVAGLC